MALNMKMAGPFGDEVSVYGMISGYQLNRVGKSATIHMALFKDADARTAFKTAQANVVNLAAQMAEKQIARVTAQANNDKSTYQQLELDYRSLAIQLETAQAALRKVRVVDDQDRIEVNSASLSSILDEDGNFSIEGAYNYLKTLPRFKDAADID
jgi:hypothetical protein